MKPNNNINKNNNTNKDNNINKTDIKYIGVPNICFSLTDKKDKREPKFKEQRIERGYDDSETWSLTDTICRFTIPRLKLYKELNDGKPAIVPTFEDWNLILDKIILALELTTRNNGSRIWTDIETQQINEGLNLFREYFLDLWW